MLAPLGLSSLWQIYSNVERHDLNQVIDQLRAQRPQERRFYLFAGRVDHAHQAGGGIGLPHGPIQRDAHGTVHFEAGVQFARAEGIIPAPEANHAVRGAIDDLTKGV